MKRFARAALVISLVGLSTSLTVGVVLAAWTGQQNGRDLAVNGWIGADNPGEQTGTYSVDNIWQDAVLNEWDEPSHDWVHDKFNRFGQAAEDKLDAEPATKGLDFELRIHDQTYYNFTGNWNTNLPFSKGAENENPFEELIQGYTEVDTEIQEPMLIATGVDYFIDYQIDAEKNPTPTAPDFWTEIEYCDNDFASNCNFDPTGWWRKKLVVR